MRYQPHQGTKERLRRLQRMDFEKRRNEAKCGSLVEPRPRAQLLDATGAPIPTKKEIPFIQWLPDGKSVGCSIDRGPDLYAQAARFIAKGGRYALVAGGGKAELVAGFPMDGGEKGEMTVVAEELLQSAEGPQVLFAIDRLVLASVANMENFTFLQEKA